MLGDGVAHQDSAIPEIFAPMTLLAIDAVGDARASLGRYLDLYNRGARGRPHSSLDRRTPDEAYFDLAPTTVAA